MKINAVLEHFAVFIEDVVMNKVRIGVQIKFLTARPLSIFVDLSFTVEGMEPNKTHMHLY